MRLYSIWYGHVFDGVTPSGVLAERATKRGATVMSFDGDLGALRSRNIPRPERAGLPLDWEDVEVVEP